MNKETNLGSGAVFDIGKENTAFAKYFAGQSYLNMLVRNGKHLNVNYVGSHLANYDSLLILSHFKGHQIFHLYRIKQGEDEYPLCGQY